MDYSTITKAIYRSQHCQRNWDLSREIPEQDISLILTAATQCPSKQNVSFYKVHVVTNRELIEKIHDNTKGFTIKYGSNETETNTQVLANLLLVFEESNYTSISGKDNIFRNDQTWNYSQKQDAESLELLNRDKNMAVGVAAGYVNLTSSLLGYATGCCACFYPKGVMDVLNLERPPLLLMGIGYKDPNLNRRIHHLNHEFVFPTKEKQMISVQYHK